MIPRVLTIAGSDSGGGAGIQADLKTFSAFGVYGMTVVTAVTAQNSLRVNGVVGMSPDFVSLQFESVLGDFGVDSAKTGMLYSAEIVQAVSRKIQESRIPFLVVDPVMVSQSGNSLLDSMGVEMMKKTLIPLATLVTPNLSEAEALTGLSVQTVDTMKSAAEKIHTLGCRAVLVKGGHLKGNAVDVLFDGEKFISFSSQRIETQNTHGTGCTYSAAIAANLAKGKSLVEAVKISKAFVTQAIQQAFPLGKGHGPLNHFVKVKDG